MNNHKPTILICEYIWVPIDFTLNNISGTTRTNKLIMDLYKDQVNIIYCCNTDIILTDEMKSYITTIKINNYETCDDLYKQLEQYHIKYIDLGIFVHLSQIQFIEKLQQENQIYINKYLMIIHNTMYNNELIDINRLCNKVIHVDHTIIESPKNIYIPNTYSININKIDYNNILKNHSIFICNGHSRFSDEDIDNLLYIFKKLKERIPDLTLKLCRPNYDKSLNIQEDGIIDLGSIPEEELFQELLQTPILYQYYNVSENCPTSSMNALLCKTFVLSKLVDGTQNIVTNNYKQFGVLNKQNDEIVDLMYDIIINNDKYNNLLLEQINYIKNNFNKTIIQYKYQTIINNLLYPSFFDSFDKVWFLTLSDSYERHQNIINTINKYKITNADIYYGVKNKNLYQIIGDNLETLHTDYYDYVQQTNQSIYSNVANTTTNHYNVIKISYDLGYNHILICEDDITFIDNEFLNLIHNNLNFDYDIIKFVNDSHIEENNQYNELKNLNNQLFKLVNKESEGVFLSSECYALSRSGMKKYIDFFNEGNIYPSDVIFYYLLKNININMYILKYNISKKSNYKSNIVN